MVNPLLLFSDYLYCQQEEAGVEQNPAGYRRRFSFGRSIAFCDVVNEQAREVGNTECCDYQCHYARRPVGEHDNGQNSLREAVAHVA